MKKAERIEAFVRGLRPGGETYDPCYLAYFDCFNACEYYEAHDVLEHLWLRERGSNHLFYKGLIQFAGAFVHLKKQRLRPDHPTDGRRLHPAVRLFKLALHNLEPFPGTHLGLDLAQVKDLACLLTGQIEASGFRENPWSQELAPKLIPPNPA